MTSRYRLRLEVGTQLSGEFGMTEVKPRAFVSIESDSLEVITTLEKMIKAVEADRNW